MSTDLQRFTGKTAIVTGSSKGIGRAIADRFHAEGANVIVNSRHAAECGAVVAELGEERALAVPGDVSDRSFARLLVEKTLARFGGLDTLVNNAGTASPGMLADAEDEAIDTMIDTNVKGVLYLCRAAIPALEKTGGSIVNVSSVSGLGGDWSMPIYCASKGAVSNLTRALGLQLGAQGVRVNAVCPSLTRTELTSAMMDNDKLMEALDRRMPLGGPIEPEAITGAVAFLASEDARHITGVNLPVDGGVNASNGQPNFGAYQ